MGGLGSGSHYHWWRSRKKTAVEDCLGIDANKMAREGALRAGVRLSGSLHWQYANGRTCSIGYEVDARNPGAPWMRLSYTWTRPGTDQREDLDYCLWLVATRPRFGGLRWWFLCPLSVSGRACGRRIGKLYLPPSGRYFGCRTCHDLTYTSAQTHDKRKDLFRRYPELAIKRLLERLDKHKDADRRRRRR